MANGFHDACINLRAMSLLISEKSARLEMNHDMRGYKDTGTLYIPCIGRYDVEKGVLSDGKFYKMSDAPPKARLQRRLQHYHITDPQKAPSTTTS